MSRQLTEEQFLKDVATHQLTILRNEGVNRHLRFRRPGTYCMGFDLITWSGHLCYTGDMGTYVFSRIEDMFQFFRRDPEACRPGTTLFINTGYWAEKCLAADKNSGITRYEPDRFREAVKRWLDEAEASPEVRELVEDQVLCAADDGEYAAHHAAREFEHDGFTFRDFWEVRLHEETYTYVWCCYALTWGVQQYDKAMEGQTVPA